MKIVLFVSIIAVVFAAEDIPEEERLLLKDVHEICQSYPDTYAEEGLLKQLWENKDNKQVQIHMRCMATKAGLLNTDGSFKEDVVKSKIGFLIKSEKATNRIYKVCTVSKGSIEETITCFWACMAQQGTEYYHKFD